MGDTPRESADVKLCVLVLNSGWEKIGVQEDAGNYKGDQKKKIMCNVFYGFELIFQDKKNKNPKRSPPWLAQLCTLSLNNFSPNAIHVCKHGTMLPSQPLRQKIVLYSTTKVNSFTPARRNVTNLGNGDAKVERKHCESQAARRAEHAASGENM